MFKKMCKTGRTASINKGMTVKRIFLITNFVVELPSAVFDQLSAMHKPMYALLSMMMSFVIMLISVIDLALMGRKKRVNWMIRGHVPWFYSPHPSYKPLGSFADIVGFVCAIFQCVFASIAYFFLSHQANNPIQISIWPIIFAFGVLCSRFPRNPSPHTLSSLELLEVSQHSRQPPETALLLQDENNGEVQRHAEVARLLELHTFKGRVESMVKLKGLKTNNIQRTYSI